MEKRVIKAYAKINLTLDCLGKRPDGYHELEMIMSEIPLYDTVTVSENKSISVITNLSYLPNNNKNIAYKAAEAFFEYTGINGGAKISIDKNIPVSAGLAGGSADGAAVLKGLNEIYNADLKQEELEKIGNEIGKDIPFCLRGGVCLAQGTGNILTSVGTLPECYIVLVKPDSINVSTAEIFSKIDNIKTELHPHTSGAIECIKNGDLKGLSQRMFNVMESVTVKIHPVISEIKNILVNKGALGAVMSGSGPSVFGIFDSEKSAKKASNYFKKIYKQTYFLKINV